MTVEALPENVVPVLQEWLLLTQAGRILGISRQRMHIVAVKERRFKTLRRLGDEEDRPIFVVRKDEVFNIKNGGFHV